MNNQIKISKEGNRLVLEIPQGMTGHQLTKWKEKNKALIESAKESTGGQYAIVSISKEAVNELPVKTPKSKPAPAPIEQEIEAPVFVMTDEQALNYFNYIVESATPLTMEHFRTYCKGNTKQEIVDGATLYFETNILN